MTPKYPSNLNIYCAAGCGQIVKSNGVPVCTHTELEHRYSAGEKSYLCRRCAYDARKRFRLTGSEGSWKAGETIEVEREKSF